MVVYPQGHWYQNVTGESAVDEILDALEEGKARRGVPPRVGSSEAFGSNLTVTGRLLEGNIMKTADAAIFREREDQIHRKGQEPFDMDCNRDSLAGAVSQRACVFCGSRVVLYPIADALHLVHGPIGCAAYTWDIRGRSLFGPGAAPAQLFNRPAGKRHHFRGRREALPGAHRTDRPPPSQGRFRLLDLYRRDNRRRSGRRLQAGCGGKEHPRASGPVRGVQGQQAGGIQRRVQGHVPPGRNGGYHPDFSPLSVNILGDFNLAGNFGSSGTTSGKWGSRRWPT